jgi:DNA-binding NarL/FixJ family response regulator
MKPTLLSPREALIARLVAKGWSNRRIAQHADMLEQSVKNALTQVYRKLRIENRVQLTLLVTGGKLDLNHRRRAKR